MDSLDSPRLFDTIILDYALFTLMSISRSSGLGKRLAQLSTSIKILIVLFYNLEQEKKNYQLALLK
jgi:hypothetical protein